MADANTAKIEAFDGDLSRAAEVMAHFELKFILERAKFNTSSLQVAYALSVCQGGKAGPWAAARVKSYSATGVWPSWTDFKKEFEEAFSPTDAATTGMARIAGLRQTGPCVEHNGKFRTYFNMTGIEENGVAIIKQAYLNTLQPALRQKVLNVNPNSIKTVTQLLACAERFDEDWRAQPKTGGFNNKRIRSTTTTPPNSNSPNDAVIRKLDDAERARLMREGKCLRCRQAGHIARNCTKFPSSNFKSRNVRAMEQESRPQSPSSSTSTSNNPTREEIVAMIRRLPADQRVSIFEDDQVFD